MAHFQRVRLAGLWLTASVLQPGEMEQLDANQSKAINGDDGGPWSPSSPIEIGGSGIKITGLAEFTGEFKVTTEAKLQGGALITGGDLTVSQNASVQGDLTVSTKAGFGGAPEAGFAAKVTGNCKVTGTCSVTGDLNAASNVSVQGAITAQGNITGDGGRLETLGIHSAVSSGKVFTADGAGNITGNFDVGGALAVTGAASAASLSVSGNATLNGTTKAKGRFKRRVLTIASDASLTVSVADYDLVFLPNGILTADRTLTLDTTGAEEGDVFRVATADTTWSLNVEFALDSNPIKVASNARRWIEATFIGGTWRTTGLGDKVD